MRELRSDTIDEVTHARLLNWGRFCRQPDNGLGFPRQVPFMQFPSNSLSVEELDAMHIEYIISTFKTAKFGLSEVHATVLKVEYLERAEGRMNAVGERAKDVSLRYRMPCSERGYYYMLSRARKAVELFADPI